MHAFLVPMPEEVPKREFYLFKYTKTKFEMKKKLNVHNLTVQSFKPATGGQQIRGGFSFTLPYEDCDMPEEPTGMGESCQATHCDYDSYCIEITVVS